MLCELRDLPLTRAQFPPTAGFMLDEDDFFKKNLPYNYPQSTFTPSDLYSRDPNGEEGADRSNSQANVYTNHNIFIRGGIDDTSDDVTDGVANITDNTGPLNATFDVGNEVSIENDICSTLSNKVEGTSTSNNTFDDTKTSHGMNIVQNVANDVSNDVSNNTVGEFKHVKDQLTLDLPSLATDITALPLTVSES